MIYAKEFMKLKNATEILRALSDQGRLRIILALMENESCVCKLTALLGLASSTMSKHLSILKRAGLVKFRRDGTWLYYRISLSDKNIRQMLFLLNRILYNDPRVQLDRSALRKIRQRRLQSLCRNPQIS